MGWFSIPDNLPVTAVDAVYCPTYSLDRSGARLTVMTELCLREGTALLRSGKTQLLICSNALFPDWRQEWEVKLNLLGEEGVDLERCYPLGGAADTYEETTNALRLFDQLGVRSVLIVAEKYHMRRALQAFRLVAPQLTSYNLSVACRKRELPWHPSLLRSWIVGTTIPWAMWNLLFYTLAPLIVAKRR